MMETVDILSDDALSRLLLALMFLLVVAHIMGFIFQKLCMPRVIGEITAGILCGPTVLGCINPEIFNWLFSGVSQQPKLMGFVSSLGLIFLMFISGFEIQNKASKEDVRLITILTISSTILPFVCGFLLVWFWDFSNYMGNNSNLLSLQIVVAVAVAITSIPVISKIFLDLNIMQSRFARIILTTATIHDLILWAALAIAAALVGGVLMTVSQVASVIVVNLLFFLFGLFVFPRWVGLLTGYRYNILMRSSSMGFIMMVCLFFIIVANSLKVNIIFGAFLAGIIIGRISSDVFNKNKEHIKEISYGFFIPLYFAMVGLKLDLFNHFDLFFCLKFVIFAMVVSILASLLGGYWARQDKLSSFNLAVAMNARGGPGIVLACMAYEWGIINGVFFNTIIILALVSSLMAGWWLKFVLYKKWPLLRGAV